MEHLMIPVGIAVAFVVIAFSVGILLSLRKNVVSPSSSQFKGTDLGKELGSDLKGSLNRLSLSSEKQETVSRLVTQEIAARSEKVRHEIETQYREKVKAKDDAIKTAEKKFVSMTQDYLQLGRSKKCTEAVVRSVSEGRVVVNEEGIAVQVNEAAERILGKKKSEILGKRVADLKGKRQMVSYIQKMSHAEEAAIAHFADDQGLQKRIRSSSAVIETESGQTRGMIATTTDTIAEQEVDDCKMAFVASVTHELRTPLVCIQKSLRALSENDGSVGQEEFKNYISIAERNSQKLSAMVNQILDFSKLQSGQIKPNFDLLNIYDLLHEVAADMQAWANDKQISVSVIMEDEQLAMEADRVRLAQVLTNLLSNALKFTPRGGKIELVAAKAQASEDFIPSGDVQHIQFEVHDSGVGIPQNDIKSIFSTFSQASNQATDGETGSGLGLSIVQEIVKQHHGQVWVRSEEKKGTSFYFVLPQYPLVAEPMA